MRQSSLGKEHDRGNSPGQFFQHSRDHDQPISSHVMRNQQEGKLPCQSHTDESIKVFGMIDRRWKVQAHVSFHKVLRKQRNNAIDSRCEEDAFGELMRYGHGGINSADRR